MRHDGEPDEVATCGCGAELETCPVADKGVTRERAQFAFAMTHRRDGTPIRHLDTKGAMLSILELGWCGVCEKHVVVLDSTDDKEYWASLPKWEKPM